MSVTYDDSVGVEVSSDSFWEVMSPLLMTASLRLLVSSFGRVRRRGAELRVSGHSPSSGWRWRERESAVFREGVEECASTPLEEGAYLPAKSDLPQAQGCLKGLDSLCSNILGRHLV